MTDLSDFVELTDEKNKRHYVCRKYIARVSDESTSTCKFTGVYTTADPHQHNEFQPTYILLRMPIEDVIKLVFPLDSPYR